MLAFAWTAQAQSECTQDIDCDGNLVCLEGTCQEPPPPPLEEATVEEPEVDPCQNVACSNHGICVNSQGKPACSCDEGYAPDAATGLSCLPVAAPTTPPPAPLVPVVPQVQGPDPEQLAVEAALGRNRSIFYNIYKRTPAYNTQMSYVDYEIKLAKAKRNSGIATLFCSPLIIGVGASLYIVFVEMVEFDPIGYLFIGLGSAGTLAMIITGAAKWGKYSGWMKKLKQAKRDLNAGEAPKEAEEASTSLRLEGVAPVLSRNGTPTGAALSFSF